MRANYSGPGISALKAATEKKKRGEFSIKKKEKNAKADAAVGYNSCEIGIWLLFFAILNRPQN